MTAGSREKEFFSTHDAAKICRVTPMTVIRWIKEGRIPAFTTAGGHRRISRADLVRFCKLRSIPFPLDSEPAQGRVLVVDADAAIRNAVAEAARAVAENLTIELAGDAFVAGQALATLRPQLLFLDQRLPGIDAPDLVARLARDPDDPISVVVMSTSSAADNERAYRNRGALGCLTKPPNSAAVDKFVRAVFQLPGRTNGSASIHIIDPDGRSGKSLRRDLEAKLPGCRVMVFASAVDALPAFRVEAPDLVLFDAGELELGPADLVRRMLLAAGARALVVKPFVVEEVIERFAAADGSTPDAAARPKKKK